jgi:hypothetical protein
MSGLPPVVLASFFPDPEKTDDCHDYPQRDDRCDRKHALIGKEPVDHSFPHTFECHSGRQQTA